MRLSSAGNAGCQLWLVIPMAATALTFAYLLNKYEGAPLATHAIVRGNDTEKCCRAR